MAKKKNAAPAQLDPFLDPFRPYLKELKLAYKRMNSSPIKRLDWLLRFAYEDLSSLSAGQLSDRRWELVMFAGEGAKPEKLDAPDSSNPLLLLPDHNPALTDRFLRSFQEEMKANFQGYFSPKGWRYKRPEIEEFLVFDYDPAKYQVQYTGTLPGPVEFLVDISFDLLKAGRDRMRKCERCKKPFVEKRKGRARFCSRKCSAYVKLKKWREKKKA